MARVCREKQKISNIGLQVQQLTEISAVFSRRLEQTVRATRRKPTPLLLAYRRPPEVAMTAAPSSTKASKPPPPPAASYDPRGIAAYEV
jgi:hypothetical protein